MYQKTALGLLSCLLAFGCDDKKSTNTPAPPVMAEPTVLAKLKITSDGQILLDEKPISLDQLSPALAPYRNKDGVVLYYREKSPDASAQSLAVEKSVMQISKSEKVAFKLAKEPF